MYGLRKLKRLRLTGPHIEHQWCKLLKLEYLCVGFDSDKSLCQPPQLSLIRIMETECPTWALQDGGFYGETTNSFRVSII